MECPHATMAMTIGLSLKELANRVKDGIRCSACQAKSSVWICLTCGEMNCGRYVKGHGVAHYETCRKKISEKPNLHSLCLEVQELSVFCYACDDFIVNDTSDTKLDKMRNVLNKLRGTLENEVEVDSDIVEPKKPIKSRRRSSVKGEGEENQPLHKKFKNSTRKTPEQVHQLRGLVGLRNLGNTCFMSAVLQSLSNIQEFCHVLQQLPCLEGNGVKNGGKRETRGTYSKNGISAEGGPIMTEELRKVLMALNPNQPGKKKNAVNNDVVRPDPSSRKVVSPEALFLVIWKVVPRFRGYQQQDAHEFLRYMLDRLHTELLLLIPKEMSCSPSLSAYFKQLRRAPQLKHSSSNTSGTSSHSLVTNIFGGTLQSEVTCLICKASSKKHDPFLDLSIDIPSSFAQQRKSKDGLEKPNCHLHDCLQKFIEIEELADSERFFCNNCKSKQRSTKKFWIRRLPNVLCLHLKRFRWSPYSRTKLDTHVEFPLTELDMSSYLLSNLYETRCSNSSSSLYDLAAVIVHHGSGAGSGHYTAFVVKDHHWFHFNDSTVLATDPDTVVKSKAYILFYIQREFKGPSAS